MSFMLKVPDPKFSTVSTKPATAPGTVTLSTDSSQFSHTLQASHAIIQPRTSEGWKASYIRIMRVSAFISYLYSAICEVQLTSRDL